MYSEIITLLNEKEQLDNERMPLLSKITCLDKTVLKEICDFLRCFVKLSTEIEGEKYLTLYKVWPTFNTIEKHISYQFNDTNLIKLMKTAGRVYFQRILGDLKPKIEHKLALFLHPMTKQLNKLTIEEKNEIYLYVNDKIETTETIDQSNTIDNIESNENDSTQLDDSLCIFEFLDSHDVDENTSRNNMSTELEDYKSIKITIESTSSAFQKFDLNEWWFNHKNRFPKLFKLFLKNSSIPASSSPSERVFSTAGSIVTDKRASIEPGTVNDIIVARNKYFNEI